MGRFILALFCFFALEIVVLIEVGSAIGALSTLGLVMLGMLVGATLVKLRFEQVLLALKEGRESASELIFLPLAGFFFIFPGFISDMLALLLLIPTTQQRIISLFRFSGLFVSRTFTGFGSDPSSGYAKDRPRVIDAEYTEIRDDDKDPQNPGA